MNRKQLALAQKTAEQLLDAVPSLMRLISSEAQSGGDYALTMTQLRVLGLLTRGYKLPSELARELKITPATASEVIDLLVRRGLVERGDHPQDRRLSPLQVTLAGSSRLAAARQRALKGMMRLLAGLEPADLNALERGMRLLLEALRGDATAPDGSENAD